MNWNRKFGLLSGVVAMCLTAGSLSAADCTGSFTLPSQTQWGSAVLPAGDYTFILDHAAIDGRILLRQGTKGVAIVHAQGFSMTSASGASSMLIVEGRVRSLHLASLGLTYNYPSHHDRGRILARASTVRGVAVAVAAK